MELTHESVLLTGATGYVGVKAPATPGIARRPRPLPDAGSRGASPSCRSGHRDRRGEVSVPATLAPAFAGVTTAYYMIHSMGAGGHFVEEDRAAAETRWCDTFAFQGGARQVRRDTNPRAACVYFQSEIAPRGRWRGERHRQQEASEHSFGASLHCGPASEVRALDGGTPRESGRPQRLGDPPPCVVPGMVQ